MILYMYDPCSFYMNNVGWGGGGGRGERLVERQTISEEIRFPINIKTYCHFCLTVQISVILRRNQICFSVH